ncbi:hypothetical protein RUND412_007351 [Rhizina undulata]
MGGIGKSQIALEYAHCDRFSRGYTSIFWIDADSDFQTKASAFEVVKQLVSHYAKKWYSSPDYSVIANTLGIPGKIDDSGRILPSVTETALEAVHNWLEKKENRGWLLLVDNKDKDADDFSRLLPSCNWGSVIRLAGRNLSPEKASVLTIWELSFQELCDDARQLLQLCAFLDNEDIPEELFRRGKEVVDWILEAYQDLGLYNQAEDSYQRALARQEKALGSDHPDTLNTVHNMALVFHSQGRCEEALEMYQRVLAGGEKALRSDHPNTLLTMHNIALVFDNQERYEEALEMYQRVLEGARRPSERALAGREKTLGKVHDDNLSAADWIAKISAER